MNMARHISAVNGITCTLSPEGEVADAAAFSTALRSLVGVVGHNASDVADSLVDAGMDGEAAAEIAFNLQGWT